MKFLKNDKGYLLLEALVGLALLSIITTSLLITLPLLIEVDYHLDKRQFIYQRLFELHDRQEMMEFSMEVPFAFEVFRQEERWCAIYLFRGETHEICI